MYCDHVTDGDGTQHALSIALNYRPSAKIYRSCVSCVTLVCVKFASGAFIGALYCWYQLSGFCVPILDRPVLCGITESSTDPPACHRPSRSVMRSVSDGRWVAEMYQVLRSQVQVQVQVPKPQVRVQVPCVNCKYTSSWQLPM